MTSDRWEKVKEIFEAALDSDAQDRESVLDRMCGRDSELRAEVARLLSSFHDAGDFLSEPAVRTSGDAVHPGELLANRYKVVHLLGRGGMGEVYEVTDELLNERVALKTLRLEISGDSATVLRFRKEIQLARKVTHPNVCRVLEVGVHTFEDSLRPPLHFFTMQLLHGETLAQRIQRTGRIPEPEAFPLVAALAEGLQAAHDEGIVHRDFKSANVILTENRPVITDFGLARSISLRNSAETADSLTGGTQVAGTVAYMSPEQLSGEKITAASDIYSLGVVLFEMATGQRPYESERIIPSAMQRASGHIPSVRALAPDIDRRWESAIERCLQREPSQRFARADEIAALFTRRAWKVPRLYWTRRRWAAAAAGAILPLGAGAALIARLRRPYRPTPEALSWYSQGVDAFRAGTWDKARKLLERSTATDGRYAPAYAYLAAVYNELDVTEQAKETMLRALVLQQDERLTRSDSLQVSGMQYVISRDFERAQGAFDELATLASEAEKLGAYLDLAWLAQKRDRPADLEQALGRALALNPSDAAANVKIAQVYIRQHKQDAAESAFRTAESLFNVSGNYDGVAEALLQHAVALGRMSKTTEAIRVIEHGMKVAETTGSQYYLVRLQLALALAYRNAGQVQPSQTVAEQAVKTALENRMDSTAAIGLIDLGSAYLLRGEPLPAERYFRQGLEFAQRGRALFSEARAKLSLGSLTLEYDRPTEAQKWAESSLPFFHQAGFRREEMQNLLVLGGAQNTLAKFEEAEPALQKALQLAEQIHDKEQAGIIHAYLGEGFVGSGKWPAAIAEQDKALNLYGEMRGGYRAAFAYVFRARIWARLGRFGNAESDLKAANSRIAKLEGEQAQLKARLALGQTELAYFRTDWAQALERAHLALTANGGSGENLEASLWSGLAKIRLGNPGAGIASCEKALAESREKNHEYSAGADRQFLAEALLSAGSRGPAREYARQALEFFEAHQCWEGCWRSRAVIQTVDQKDDPLAPDAVAKLRQTWPAEFVMPYANRPDLKQISQSGRYFL